MALGFWLHRDSWTSLLVASCLLGSVVSGTACKSADPASAKQTAADQDTHALRSVKAVGVREVLLERSVTALGSLAAYDQATLSVKVPGRLAAISVDFASAVKRGQEVAHIEPRDYQLRLRQAEAALAQARARLGLPPHGTDDRVDPEQTSPVRQARALLDEARQNRDRLAALSQKGFVSRAEYDAAEAAYKVALGRHQDAVEEIRNRQALLLQRRSELEIARQQLADTTIRAPFDGVIQVRHASVGEYLAEGAPVVTLVRMDPLRLRAEVPERAAPSVRAGQKVRVTIEGDANVYEGRVMRLGPTINEQNRMLTVEADVRNDGLLRPGSFARSEIVTAEGEEALAVPAGAVVTFAGLEKVFLVRDGKAVETPVSTGRRADGWVEVIAGVNRGERVILDPGSLRSGQPVRVLPQ
ncbi:MAG: efflux RND transporter periplasmic adaptor subunit [Thermodesulfobacteriota bacterium]